MSVFAVDISAGSCSNECYNGAGSSSLIQILYWVDIVRWMLGVRRGGSQTVWWHGITPTSPSSQAQITHHAAFVHCTLLFYPRCPEMCRTCRTHRYFVGVPWWRVHSVQLAGVLLISNLVTAYNHSRGHRTFFSILHFSVHQTRNKTIEMYVQYVYNQ